MTFFNIHVQIMDNKKSIYDLPEDSTFLSIEEIEKLLCARLIGLDFSELALRTRAKNVKIRVCEALDYRIPKSFKRSHPGFPNQNLDVITQKSNNLQLWNEPIDPIRRYAIIKLDSDNKITHIKVLSGNDLLSLVGKETLTQKYQALLPAQSNSGCYSSDTAFLQNWLCQSEFKPSGLTTSLPVKGELLPISVVFERLYQLIGAELPEISKTQERNRGWQLHLAVCQCLGFSDNYIQDKGSFPDIPNQLIEVKLQTSETVDLGKYCPDSGDKVLGDFGTDDIRYVIFYPKIL